MYKGEYKVEVIADTIQQGKLRSFRHVRMTETRLVKELYETKISKDRKKFRDFWKTKVQKSTSSISDSSHA